MGGRQERLVVRDYLWKLVEKVVDAGRYCSTAAELEENEEMAG